MGSFVLHLLAAHALWVAPCGAIQLPKNTSHGQSGPPAEVPVAPAQGPGTDVTTGTIAAPNATEPAVRVPLSVRSLEPPAALLVGPEVVEGEVVEVAVEVAEAAVEPALGPSSSAPALPLPEPPRSRRASPGLLREDVQAALATGGVTAEQAQQSAGVPPSPSPALWEACLEKAHYLSSFAIWSAFALLVAGHNESLKSRLWSPPSDGLEHTLKAVNGKWKYGPFACLGDPAICAFTALCAPVRWADTMHMAGIFGFWCSVGGFLLALLYLHVLALGFFHGWCSSGLLVNLGINSWLVLVLVQVYHRQKLRERFHMLKSRTGFMEDFLMHCLCPFCAICQEARHIEEAHAVGHPAVEDAQFRDMIAPKYH